MDWRFCWRTPTRPRKRRFEVWMLGSKTHHSRLACTVRMLGRKMHHSRLHGRSSRVKDTQCLECLSLSVPRVHGSAATSYTSGGKMPQVAVLHVKDTRSARHCLAPWCCPPQVPQEARGRKWQYCTSRTHAPRVTVWRRGAVLLRLRS
jgi:hypothetical protein